MQPGSDAVVYLGGGVSAARLGVVLGHPGVDLRELRCDLQDLRDEVKRLGMPAVYAERITAVLGVLHGIQAGREGVRGG